MRRVRGAPRAAARITIAEGGSYRRISDKTEDNEAFQNGQRVDLTNFDWGAEEYPGFGGSFGRMIAEFGKEFPGTKFDYIDLSYDAYRDAAGKFRRIEVPRAPNGVGAFGARPDYYIARTIRECDFLIDVPVMKVHLQCGLTACLKNYVGTAVREAYQLPGLFNNSRMHREHSLDDRIDHFIADLASFHPPDYCVVDGICGLQYQEHNNERADQMVRSNLVLAGEDPVALDAMAARLIGFSPLGHRVPAPGGEPRDGIHGPGPGRPGRRRSGAVAPPLGEAPALVRPLQSRVAADEESGCGPGGVDAAYFPVRHSGSFRLVRRRRARAGRGPSQGHSLGGRAGTPRVQRSTARR